MPSHHDGWLANTTTGAPGAASRGRPQRARRTAFRWRLAKRVKMRSKKARRAGERSAFVVSGLGSAFRRVRVAGKGEDAAHVEAEARDARGELACVTRRDAGAVLTRVELDEDLEVVDA